jgi:hypothetical protein
VMGKVTKRLHPTITACRRAVTAIWCSLFHRRFHRHHIVGLFDCECQCEKCGRLWVVN